MPDGMFDDLVPATPKPARTSLFDDLVPSATADFSNVRGAANTVPATPAEAPGSFLDIIAAPFRGLARANMGEAATRGATSALASGIHSATDFIDQTVQGPIRSITEALGMGPTFQDPLHAAAAANESLAVEREINADRSAAQAGIGGRPSLTDLMTDPAKAVEQYTAHLGNIGAESAPLMAAAIATRNPEIGASLMGALTGAQEYTDLRGQGIERLPAAVAGLGTGAVETAGESIGLPAVMGKGGGIAGLLRAMLVEGGQEAPVQVAQQQLDDLATGQQTPMPQQLGDALDALLVGSAMGGGGHVASVATDKLTQPRAAPPNGNVPAPAEPNGAPEQRRRRAAAALDVAAPILAQPEDTSDLDALLAARTPAPETATPTPTSGRDSQPARDLVPAQAELPPAEPDGSRPAGGDLAHNAPHPNEGWVLREKATDKAVMETRDPEKVAALNTDKYEAVPVGQHLAELNQPDTLAYKAARATNDESRVPAGRTTQLPESASAGLGEAADEPSIEQRALAPELSRQHGREDARANGLVQAVNDTIGETSVPVTYVRGIAGLPEHVRTAIESRNAGRPVQTAALYDPKEQRAYILTDRVTDPKRAAWHAAHEIAGHHGLRGLFKDHAKLNTALDLALQNPTVSGVADAIAGERKSGDRRLMAEEALAELAAATRTGNFDEIAKRYKVDVPLAQRNTLRAAIARFIERIKALFRKSGFSDADVHSLVENAWKAAKKPRTNGDEAAIGEPEALESAEPQTETPEFRRWFGDSKVVDAAGKPLVVYHGTTSSFDNFSAEHQGKVTRATSSKEGYFFTSSPRTAQSYADHGATVTPVQELVSRAETAGNRGDWDTHDKLMQEAEALEGSLIGDGRARGQNLMPAYLSLQNPLTIDAAGETPEGIGGINKLIAQAKRRGHDGVIIRNFDDAAGLANDNADHFIAFRPEQIKSATANSGAFDPSKPSILESVEGAEARAESRREDAAESLPVARGAAGWDYDSGQWVGRKGRLNSSRAHLQDKMLAWRDVQGQIESKLGQAIPDAQNVYRLENLMHGRVSDAIERIERDQVKPLMDAMKASKVDPATLEEYLYARHAKERNTQIATINPSMPDGGSGMTNAEADAILSRADKAKLEPLAKRVDGLTTSTRRRLLANGLITQEAFDAMQAQYQHYVPLRGKRTAEDADFGGGGMAGRGLDSRGKPVRQALGRGAGNRAEHILGEVIGDAERSVILAEKARVGRAVMRLVLANPNPALWEVEPVQTERALDASGEVYDRVVNDWSDPSVVAVKHKGQLYKVQINSVPLAQALNNVGIDKLGTITRYAGTINRFFSAILTKYNPAFTPVNAARDALFGLTGMAAEHGELAALDAALHYPQAAVAAFQQARGKALPGEWGGWATEFAEHGGKTGYVNLPSAEDIARKIGTGKLTSYHPDGLRRAARAVADVVGTLNDAVENALRLSAYVTLRKRGASADKAAAYAKDLTVNFNRKGFDGSTWNAWFLFYNASLQGAHRTSKLLRHPKTYAYLGMLAGAQVIATMAAMGMRDDNDEPLWNKVPDHVKQRNIVLVTKDGGLITIPMPYGFNLFPYMAGRITEAVLNAERGDKRATDRPAQLVADTLSTATQSFSPVPLDTGPVGLIPNALRIPINVWANRNDFGGPIRDEDPYAKSDVPRASMGRPDTLEVFKLAATGLNRLGGGDELTPPPMSAFDVAPEDLEYLLKELTGGPGKLVTDIATVGGKMADDAAAAAQAKRDLGGMDAGANPSSVTPRDIPILSRFRSNIDEQAAQQAMFYQRREAIDRALKRVRHAYKAEGPEAAEALLKATPELTGAAFKRRKVNSKNGDAGGVIESDGSPQIVTADDRSVYGRYKAAEKANATRSEHVEAAYTGAPASALTTPEGRQRDTFIRSENRIRQAAQAEFNDAWVRDVVGSAE